MGSTVTLQELLAARDSRAARQRELLAQYGRPVVSFCMNIAGPVKQSPVTCRGFREGQERLAAALGAARLPVVFCEERAAAAGCEALWVVDGPVWQLKEVCMEIEERDALGRLFDLDVLAPGGGKLSREDLGFPPRPCLICGQRGKGCASRRIHAVQELQEKTDGILSRCFAARDRETLAAMAGRALLYEVCTTPKPGLVDRWNNGSHRDMDVFTFMDSTTALLPYFKKAVEIGQETAGEPPARTFRRLREAGLRAEKAMFCATKGVNTHKGLIFSLGCILGAAGRLWTPEGPCREAQRVLEMCRQMVSPAVEEDLAFLARSAARTEGERLYVSAGLRGARGEAADGFPAVQHVGLPALRAALGRGATLEKAGVTALLALMQETADTNLVARGGMEGRHWAAEQAARLLSEGDGPSDGAVREFDQEMIRRNLSPGGCADLLAITFFLHFLEEGAEEAGEGVPAEAGGMGEDVASRHGGPA